MGQEVSFDLDAAVEQMTAIDEVSNELKETAKALGKVASRQVPVDWTQERGAIGFANQFQSTGHGLLRVLSTLHQDMSEMYEELKATIDEFVANDEEKQERYMALMVKYNLKGIGDNLNMAGAAIGAVAGGPAGAAIGMGAAAKTVDV